MKLQLLKLTAIALFLIAATSSLTLNVHASAKPAAFQVNSTLDVPDAKPGNGVCETAKGNHICTLRAAIQETNALPGKNTIKLQATTYYLTLVKTKNNNGLNGSLYLLDDLVIKGKGADKTKIDGNNGAIMDRILNVGPFKVKLVGLTLQNASYAPRGAGAAIANSGKLTLTGVTVTHNSAEFGGGILNQKQLFLNNSTVSLNHSNTNGGGIANMQGATATLTNSTVSGNTSDQAGGGIYLADSTVNLRNVTLAVNLSDYDLDDTGMDTGGGFYNDGGIVNARNTIIAENYRSGFAAADDCDGQLNSEDYNFLETTARCVIQGIVTNNKIGIPGLGPLQLNGGTTETNALLPNSPAIDAGASEGCLDQVGNLLKQDQRGYKRTFGARCDIGAYEFQPNP